MAWNMFNRLLEPFLEDLKENGSEVRKGLKSLQENLDKISELTIALEKDANTLNEAIERAKVGPRLSRPFPRATCSRRVTHGPDGLVHIPKDVDVGADETD
jgi:hypothetical protein